MPDIKPPSSIRGDLIMTLSQKKADPFSGSLMKNIIFFSIPLILTGLLQTFYNAADLMVVGFFDGETALAAVGNTGSINNLVVGLFMGLSVGAGVCVAHDVGANRRDSITKVVHTSILVALILGVAVSVFGVLFAPKLLALMDTPENVISLSTLYIRIVFCGIPFSMVYNYSAAMLRSTGDTKHPLIFLSIAGLVNVVTNVVLVAIFKLGVAGVAIATLLSQALSCAMIVIFLIRIDGALKFSPRMLRIYPDKLKKILTIGIPSGLQGTLFSLSNVIIQSSVNSFGSTIMAANSAASNLEQFVYISMNAQYHSSLTFIGQSVGAGRYDRIKKILGYCCIVVSTTGILIGALIIILRYPLLNLYAPNQPDVAAAAVKRLFIILPTYWLCGTMEVLCGGLRSMGKSFLAMVISLMGACAFRILWVKTVFASVGTIESLYISYPASWLLTTLCHMVFCMILIRRFMKIKKQSL